MISVCTKCQKLYDAGSQEQAYEPDRLCRDCAKSAGFSVPPLECECWNGEKLTCPIHDR